MKPIVAKNQVSLGPVRCCQLAISGMSFRMFRAGITIAILALAVAFLVHMLAYGLMRQAVRESASAELDQHRSLASIIARMSSPDNRPAIIGTLAKKDPDRLPEYRKWAQIDNDSLQRAIDAAGRLETAARALDRLPATTRVALLIDATPEEQLALLVQPEQYDLFRDRFLGVGDIPWPEGDEMVFRMLVTQEATHLDMVAHWINKGHQAAILQLRDTLGGQPPAKALLNPSPELTQAMVIAGFHFDPERMVDLVRLAQSLELTTAISELLSSPQARSTLARDTGIRLADLGYESLMNFIRSPSRAEVILPLVQQQVDRPVPAAALVQLAIDHRRHRQLQYASGSAADRDQPLTFGLPNQTLYLIALSFLVCTVGVANAMLMSVTERFSEIATMKCLGAMDGFIMLMFVFEAAIQGVVGGIIGLALGIALAVMRGLFEWGWLISGAGDALVPLVIASLASVVVGVILAVVAAVGPARLAARLAPMEAMRVD